MLIADDSLAGAQDLVEACLAAERGGATSILLRLTRSTPRELAASARVLLGRLTVPLLVSGRADVAMAVGAAGVHLGLDDVPVPVVRRVARRGFLIGATVGTMQEVENGRGADYWALAAGATGAGTPELRDLVRRAEGRPWVATGVATSGAVVALLAAGAAGVAFAAQLTGTADIEEAVRQLATGV